MRGKYVILGGIAKECRVAKCAFNGEREMVVWSVAAAFEEEKVRGTWKMKRK